MKCSLPYKDFVSGPIGPVGSVGTEGKGGHGQGPWEVTPLWLRCLGFKNRRRSLWYPFEDRGAPPWYEYASAKTIAHNFLRDQFGYGDQDLAAPRPPSLLRLQKVVDSSKWTGR